MFLFGSTYFRLYIVAIHARLHVNNSTGSKIGQFNLFSSAGPFTCAVVFVRVIGWWYLSHGKVYTSVSQIIAAPDVWSVQCVMFFIAVLNVAVELGHYW